MAQRIKKQIFRILPVSMAVMLVIFTSFGFLNFLPLIPDVQAADTVSDAWYIDADADGTVDHIVIEFDTNITQCDYENTDWDINTAGDFNISITGIDTSDPESNGFGACDGSDAYVYISVDADADETGSSSNPDISYTNQGTANDLQDSGNITDKANIAAGDSALPVVFNIAYWDDDNDGGVDTIGVALTEEIDVNDAVLGDFTYVANDITSSALAGGTANQETGDSVFTITLGTPGDQYITSHSTAPTLAYVDGGATEISDSNGNQLASFGATNLLDFAEPVVISLEYYSSGSDGTVDSIDVVYSETVTWGGTDYAQFEITINDLTDFDDDGEPEGVSAAGDTITIDTTGTADLTGVSGGTEPSLDYAYNSVLNEGVQDIADNYAPDFGATSIDDTASPVALGGLYVDIDNDGSVDGVGIGFSEDIDTNTAVLGDFTYVANDITGSAIIGGTYNAETGGTNVTFDLGTNGPSYRTSHTIAPTLAYTDGGGTEISDAEGNQVASFIAIDLDDGAAPAIMDVEINDTGTPDGIIDQIIITWSENIDTDDSAAPVLADFGTIILPDGSAVTSASITDPAMGTDEITLTNVVGQSAQDTSMSLVDIDGITNEWTDGSNLTFNPDDNENLTDNAAPMIVDVDIYDTGIADGLIDQLIVTWSENVDTDDSVAPVLADFGTITLPDGSPVTSASITDPAMGTNIITLTNVVGQSSQDTAAGSTDIDGITNEWTDGSLLTANPDDNETITDSAAPVALLAGYIDGTGDGQIDSAGIQFSENVTYVYQDSDWSGTDADDITGFDITGCSSCTDVSLVVFDAIADPDITGAEFGDDPDLEYAAGNTIDDQAPSPNSAANFALTDIGDYAQPVILGNGEYYDNDNDGDIDEIYLYTSVDNGLVCTGFTGGTDLDVTTGGDMNLTESLGDTCGTDGISEIYITLGTEGDTDVTGSTIVPIVDYSQPGDGIEDGAGNDLSSRAGINLDDLAAPIVLSAVTRDDDGNGQIDSIEVTYSEAVNDPDYDQIDVGRIMFGTGSGDGTAVITYEYAEDGSPDTDATLSLSWTSIGADAADLGGLPVDVSSAPAFSTDGAAPQVVEVTSSTGDGTYGPGIPIDITLTFSESVISATGLGISLNNTASANIVAWGPVDEDMKSATYTVGVTGSGQDVIDLDITNPLAGTITDVAANSTVNPSVLAGENLADNQDIDIDTTAPAVPAATDLAAASDSGDFDDDDITNVTNPSFEGSAENGANVDVYSSIDGLVGSGPAVGGFYSITTSALTGSILGTAHGITVVATDAYGNASAASAALAVTIDTGVNAPSVPDMNIASDSGFSNIDDLTNVTTPQLDGTAETNATVEITSDLDGSVGSGPAAGGNYAVTVAPLTGSNAGTDHSITATATDVAGNTSAVSGGLSVTIDTGVDAPSVPDLAAASDSGDYDDDDITNVTTPTFEGTCNEANAQIILRSSIDGVPMGNINCIGGNYAVVSAVLTGSALGTVHDMDVNMIDQAGNTSAYSAAMAVTIDNLANTPSIPDLNAASDTGSSAIDDITNDTTPQFDGTAEAEATIQIRSNVDGVIGSDFATGGNYGVTTGGLTCMVIPPGGVTHSIDAQATDVAGNTSAWSATLNIDCDISSPTVSETTPVATPTLDPTPDYTFTSNEAGDITYGGGCESVDTTAASGANPIVLDSDGLGGDLGDGTYNCTIVVVDTAGNDSNTLNMSEFIIDTAPPTVNTYNPADNATGVSTSANLVLTFNEDVFAGAGDVVIKKTSDNSTVETITIPDPKVTYSGANATINPSVTLANSTGYYVQIDNGAIEDQVGQPYVGIADTTTWSFTTTAGGGGGGYGGYTPPTTPTNSIIIAAGAAQIASQTVSLALTSSDATQMMISNSADFSGAAWEAFSTSVTWTLTPNYGTKTVYVKFKNAAATISDMYSDSIDYVETVEILVPLVDESTLILVDPAPAAALPLGVSIGTLVKRADMPTVYFIDQDNRRHAFPSESVYMSYYPDFSDIQTVSNATMADIPLGSNVTMRPGTYLVKVQSDPKVYAVAPYGVLKWIATEAVANSLYGTGWGTRVVDVEPTFFINYQMGAAVTTNIHPTGSAFSYVGDSSVYYVDSGVKRYISSEVFINNKFQNKFIIRNLATAITYTNGADLPALGMEQIMTLK